MFEIYAFIGLVALLCAGNLAFRMSSKKRQHLIFNLAVMLLLMASICILSIAQSLYFNVISVNPFSIFFFLIFTIAIFLLNLLAYARSRDYGNFAILASFALAGMYLVASSTTLVTIFLGLELMSIPSAFMILLSRRDALEAATKFFIMASIAIALLSLAIVLVYGSTNSLSLTNQPPSDLLYFALVLFIASLGFEGSVFPFNVLLPDVYQGSAAYVTAMLGGVNKKVGLMALMQVLILIFLMDRTAFVMVAALSVITMFYGNMVALVQTNFKRMLAYSSISQAGYILIGIAVATQAGIGASIFQIFAHMFIFIGAMSMVAWLESRDRNEINDLIGLYKENRFCAIALTIFLLSLVGLPFTTGFFGKFLLILSAVNANLVWLALFGIINSMISIFYYAKVITAMYTEKVGSYRSQLDSLTLVVVIVCLAVTIVFGIYPQPIVQLANGAAGFLISGGVV